MVFLKEFFGFLFDFYMRGMIFAVIMYWVGFLIMCMEQYLQGNFVYLISFDKLVEQQCRAALKSWVYVYCITKRILNI